MKRHLRPLAALAALLLLAACEDLFQPDKPSGPPDGAYAIPEAYEHAGESGAWVQGYIVGIATSSRKFPSDTTIVRERCLAVQLPAGKIRDSLNLVDHPGLTGREIYIKGDLVDAYFGIPGLKSPSEYWMDSGSSPE